MTFRKAVLSLAVLLFSSLALAQGTYTQIDYPGAAYTQAWGINAAGNISGYYTDASEMQHGFLLSGGTYTTIDYPNATATFVYGINDLGQVVGYAFQDSTTIGFVYDVATKTFTTVSFPGSAYTYVFTINNAGTIAGLFGDGITNYGFALIGSDYSQVTPPGAPNSFVLGISASGELAGYVSRNDGRNNNFVFERGRYKLAIPNVSLATVEGINGTGTTLVGVYQPSSGINAGFLYRNKTQTLLTLQFPGSPSTLATSLNTGGEVVGSFYDSSSVEHGFTWTPPAAAGKK